jgi:glucuronate isomerase
MLRRQANERAIEGFRGGNAEPLCATPSLPLSADACWPIFDFHGHLSPERLASNAHFRDPTDLWIAGDHYKWRAMRVAGEPEAVLTGRASPRAAFDCFARTLPKAAGGPLQRWSRLELARYFAIDEPLTATSADRIWECMSAALASTAFTPRALLARANVEVVCTTDDPTDDLRAHRTIAESDALFRVLPTFRPDGALHLGSTEAFVAWCARLDAMTHAGVQTFSAFVRSLRERFDAFASLGCVLSDHGVERVEAVTCSDAEAERIYERLRSGRADAEDLAAWRGRLMRDFAEWNAERGWTMLLHLGARRNVNRAVGGRLGLDAGCDVIGDFDQGASLCAFLDDLDASGTLPRTVLFNSNPRDTLLFATIAGSFFQEGGTKVHVGPPWWFLDQQAGIVEWLEALAAVGVLGTAIGMVTDSRSFLSMTRHELFRTVVRGRLESWALEGRLDRRQVDVDALCHDLFLGNAARHFGWGVT